MKSLFVFAAAIFTATNVGAASFNEVRSVLFAAPKTSSDAVVQEELDVYASGALPDYKVTAKNFVRNGVNLLKNSAVRTIKDRADYFPRIEKLIHSSGICFAGEWKIDRANPYSGLFKQNSKVPAVVRISAASSNTKAGAKRGFGFAVKLFPTSNENESVTTANFFTVDVLMGTKIKNFMSTALTNEPAVGFDFSLIKLAIDLSKALSAADKNPLYRQLYEVSEAGLGSGEVARTPKWIMIKAAPGQALISEVDFRDELDLKNYPDGLKFEVYVSDTTKDPKAKSGWEKIGGIELNESVVSYGCDRQLHFHHPKLRE